MPTKSKATLSQAAILTAAAERRYGHVLPLPDDADAASTKAAKLLKGMLAEGLIEEWPTSSAKNAWRCDEHGKHTLLRITEAGRLTLGAPPAPEALQEVEDAPMPASQPEAEQPRTPSGKLGQVLAAVQSQAGASLGDLIAITGWQPHTIRASLTRLRQGGTPIQLIQSDGQKRYATGPATTPA